MPKTIPAARAFALGVFVLIGASFALSATAIISGGTPSSAAKKDNRSAKGPSSSKSTVFLVSFPATRSATPIDGRLILLLSTDFSREPRSHVDPDDPLIVPYIFGLNVDGMAAGQAVTLDDAAFGWPARNLSQLPEGDYFVQAVLNRYETFHLADGRTLKLPPDKGEGQNWAEKPGNLYSTPVRVHVDPKHPLKTSVLLDQQIAPVAAKTDTEYIRHIRIKSELLSKFWGRDVYLGAHVLVPKDFDKHPEAHYPLMVFHGHYPDDISDFRTTPPDADLKPDYSRRFHLAGYNRIQQQEAYAFYQKWTSADFPRFLVVEIEHANPYYDDSYAVNSANLGPYGDAINKELIPEIERRFRGIGAGLGALHLRWIDRRLGSARHPGVLSGHVQRRLRGVPGPDRLPRLFDHQPLRRPQRLYPQGRGGRASSGPRCATTWARCSPPSATPTTWN